MPAEKFFADSAAEVGLNPDKVQALMDRAEREVREGVLPACQVAIARKGKIAAMKTFGKAVQPVKRMGTHGFKGPMAGLIVVTTDRTLLARNPPTTAEKTVKGFFGG